MSTPLNLTVVTDADLERNLVESKLNPDGILSLRTAFAPHFAAFQKLATAAQAIPSTAPKAAKAMRIEIKNVRLAAEKTRKELKEDSLLRSRAVDGVNNLLLYALTPIEKHLETIEKAEEIAEQKRVEALRQTRNLELSKYAELPLYDLGVLPQAQYDLLLLGAKTAHEAKLKAEADRVEAEKKALEERAKKEAADAAERERLRVENERLAKVAAAEKKAREDAEKKAAADRKAADDKAAKEKADREAADKARIAKEQAQKAKEDAARAAEAKRIAEEAAKKQAAIEEQARKDREALQKKADEERAQREALEAAIKAREQAEAKRKADEAARLAAEQAAAQAAQEKAAAAPDKQKLIALSQAITNLAIPALTSKAGVAFLPKLNAQVAKFAAWVEGEANKL